MIGNGGLAGEAPDDPGRAAQRGSALANGFVMASTNTGHDARKEPSGTLRAQQPAEGDRLRVSRSAPDRDHGQGRRERSTTRNRSPRVWNSCSNGGRQGLIEAQRYPDDFDGIVANAPWVEQTGFTVGAMWNQRAVTDASAVGRQARAGREARHGELRRGRWPRRRLDRRPAPCAFDPRATCRVALTAPTPRTCLTPGASRRAGEDLRRRGQRRQAVVPGLHARQRSAGRRDRTARRRAAG